jgi:hypothetical protein
LKPKAAPWSSLELGLLFVGLAAIDMTSARKKLTEVRLSSLTNNSVRLDSLTYSL